MSWNDFGDNWLKNGLPTFHGGKDKNLARTSLDKLGGPGGFKTAITIQPDGTKVVVQTKGAMPPQIFTYPPMKVELPTEINFVYVGERYTGTNAKIDALYGSPSADPQKLTISNGIVTALDSIPDYATSNKYGRYMRWRNGSGDAVYYFDSASQSSNHSEVPSFSRSLTIYAGDETAPYNSGTISSFAGIVTIGGLKYVVTNGWTRLLITGENVDIGVKDAELTVHPALPGYFGAQYNLFRDNALRGYVTRATYAPTGGEARSGAFEFDLLSGSVTAEHTDTSSASLTATAPWSHSTKVDLDYTDPNLTALFREEKDDISVSVETTTTNVLVLGGVETVPGTLSPIMLTTTHSATGEGGSSRLWQTTKNVPSSGYYRELTQTSAYSRKIGVRTNTIKCGDNLIHSWDIGDSYEYMHSSTIDGPTLSDGFPLPGSTSTSTLTTWDYSNHVVETCSLLCDAANGAFALLIMRRIVGGKQYSTSSGATPDTSDRTVALFSHYVIHDARKGRSYKGSFSSTPLGTLAANGLVVDAGLSPWAGFPTYGYARADGSGELSYPVDLVSEGSYLLGFPYGDSKLPAASFAISAASSIGLNTSQDLPSNYVNAGFFGSIFADDEVLLCSLRCPYDESQHINVVCNRATGTFSTFDSEHWYQVLYKAPTQMPPALA